MYIFSGNTDVWHISDWCYLYTHRKFINMGAPNKIFPYKIDELSFMGSVEREK